MLRDRPAVVVGFGGYPPIPAMAAAWLLRSPRMIHEQNGVLGRVNQLFAKRVDQLACGTWPTAMPGRSSRACIPAIRCGPRYLSVQGRAIFRPVITPCRCLVMGGSQGARILSDVVPPALVALPLRIFAHRPRVATRRAPRISNVSPHIMPIEGSRPTCRRFLVISRAGWRGATGDFSRWGVHRLPMFA